MQPNNLELYKMKFHIPEMVYSLRFFLCSPWLCKLATKLSSKRIGSLINFWVPKADIANSVMNSHLLLH